MHSPIQNDTDQELLQYLTTGEYPVVVTARNKLHDAYHAPIVRYREPAIVVEQPARPMSGIVGWIIAIALTGVIVGWSLTPAPAPPQVITLPQPQLVTVVVPATAMPAAPAVLPIATAITADPPAVEEPPPAAPIVPAQPPPEKQAAPEPAPAPEPPVVAAPEPAPAPAPPVERAIPLESVQNMDNLPAISAPISAPDGPNPHHDRTTAVPPPCVMCH